MTVLRTEVVTHYLYHGAIFYDHLVAPGGRVIATKSAGQLGDRWKSGCKPTRAALCGLIPSVEEKLPESYQLSYSSNH